MVSNPTYRDWYKELKDLEKQALEEGDRQFAVEDAEFDELVRTNADISAFKYTSDDNVYDGKIRVALHDAQSDPELNEKEKLRLRFHFGPRHEDREEYQKHFPNQYKYRYYRDKNPGDCALKVVGGAVLALVALKVLHARG